MTVRTKLSAKSGSMPLEQPAMMLSVPVGAMVVVVALRSWVPLSLKMLRSQFANVPRSAASACEVSWEAS